MTNIVPIFQLHGYVQKLERELKLMLEKEILEVENDRPLIDVENAILAYFGEI